MPKWAWMPSGPRRPAVVGAGRPRPGRSGARSALARSVGPSCAPPTRRAAAIVPAERGPSPSIAPSPSPASAGVQDGFRPILCRSSRSAGSANSSVEPPHRESDGPSSPAAPARRSPAADERLACRGIHTQEIADSERRAAPGYSHRLSRSRPRDHPPLKKDEAVTQPSELEAFQRAGPRFRYSFVSSGPRRAAART